MPTSSVNYRMKKQGEFFGYPECCVKSFIKFVNGKGKRTCIQNITSHPEGFVPCNLHAKQIFRGDITLKHLIQNRICSVDFKFEKPNGCYFTEVDKCEEFNEWFTKK